MSVKSIWTGNLKVNLLTIPVRIVGAIDSSEKISFNRLHAACKHKTNQSIVCRECDVKDLKGDDLVKGFEHQKGSFITISDAELQAIKIPSTHTIDIKTFRPKEDIDPLLFDAPYYVAPDDGKLGDYARKAFATVREAIGDKVGIGKVALRDREYVVAIEGKGPGILMHTMHRPTEVRSIEAFDEFRYPTKASEDEVAMATMLVQRMTKPIDLNELKDEYTENLRTLVDSKIKGTSFEMPESKPLAPSTSMLDALKASLAAIDSTPAEPAKPTMTIPSVTSTAPAQRKAKTAKAAVKGKKVKAA